MMQRRHYETIAKVLKDAKPMRPYPHESEYQAAMETWDDTVRRMVLALSADNPQFKISRFETACGR